MPVEYVQSVVPHLQSMPKTLATSPSVVAHVATGRGEQVPVSAQYIPVEDVQSVVPHVQSIPGVLDVVPFVTVHTAGGRFEQVLELASQYIP